MSIILTYTKLKYLQYALNKRVAFVALFWQLKWKIQKREVMKTINKVQKIAQKTVAVVVSIILISFTVSAQDFWKELVLTNQFEQIALAFVDNTTSSKKVSINENSTRFLEFYEEAVEEELELENWMIEEKVWIL